MKTLIINGSPRKNGDTIYLINKLIEQLTGEYKIINAYYTDISPCVDCRYCWNNNGCAIADEMSEIYDYVANCDNIIMASPIYFSQPTGKLLDICSRFQTYFAAKCFRNQKLDTKKKKGAVILVGGGDGNPEKAYGTLCCILHHINVTDIYKLVGSFETNKKSPTKDNEVLTGISEIVAFINKEM